MIAPGRSRGHPSCSGVRSSFVHRLPPSNLFGNPAISPTKKKRPIGFASPPRDGFAFLAALSKKEMHLRYFTTCPEKKDLSSVLVELVRKEPLVALFAPLGFVFPQSVSLVCNIRRDRLRRRKLKGDLSLSPRAGLLLQ